MSDLPDRICIWEADENDPNSTRGWTVSFPENHPGIYIRASLNTRTAAPVEGLETVHTLYDHHGVGEWKHYPPIDPRRYLDMKTRELVTRTNAEAIIAAERAGKLIWMEKAAIEAERVTKLEADNAALTARVKDAEAGRDRVRKIFKRSAQKRFEAERRSEILTTEVTGVRETLISEQSRRLILETQLAAAKKALQKIAGDTYDDSAEKIARSALEASNGE